MARSDDFYITTLKYGRSALSKSVDVNYNEVRNHVKSIHPNIEDKAFAKIFWSAFERLQYFEGDYAEMIQNNTPHALNIEAYFHLLEHEELEEARTSSKNALLVATIAIGISIITAVASIWIQLKIPTDVVVSGSQIERVLNAIATPHKFVLDKRQIEQLRKNNERQINVILDERQFSELIGKLNELIER